MSKTEILAELPRLSPQERAEVQAKLDALASDAWQDNGELSVADRRELDATLTDYAQSPDAGGSWDAVKARVDARLQQSARPQQ